MSQNIMWTLKQIHLAMEQYGKIQMQHMGLTPTQAAMLFFLLTHKEQGNYGIQIHASLGISKSSISSTLKALRQKGYLYMRENPSDDRKKQIFLTQKAYDAEQGIRSCLQAQQNILCSQIPAQRLPHLAKDLEQMLQNLKTEIEKEAEI